MQTLGVAAWTAMIKLKELWSDQNQSIVDTYWEKPGQKSTIAIERSNLWTLDFLMQYSSPHLFFFLKGLATRGKGSSSLFICLFKIGISTDKTVYLKRSYTKGKNKKRKRRRKVIRWWCFQSKSAKGSCLRQESQGGIKLFSLKLTWNWRFAPPWEACSTGEVLCWWKRYDQPMAPAEMVWSHPVVARGYHAGAHEN